MSNLLLFLFAVSYVFTVIVTLIRAGQALRFARRLPGSDPKWDISLIKPVYGADSNTRICFESWLSQDYFRRRPGSEVLFSLQTPQDSVLPVLEELKVKYSFQTLINPIRPGLSGKTSNLYHGVKEARSEFLVFSDADIFAHSNTLNKLMSYFDDSASKDQVLVSCLPIHVDPVGIWGRIFARVWNSAILCLWAPSVSAKNPMGVAGGTIALSKNALDKMGGFEGSGSWARFLAEDIAMGRLALKHGIKIKLGPVVESPVGRMKLELLWEKLKRGNLISLHMAPMGLFYMVPIYSFMFSYLVLIVASLLTPQPGIPLVAVALICFLARLVYCAWLDAQAYGKWKFGLDFVLGDLIIIISFLTVLFHKQVQWGQKTYKVGKSGILEEIRLEESLVEKRHR